MIYWLRDVLLKDSFHLPSLLNNATHIDQDSPKYNFITCNSPRMQPIQISPYYYFMCLHYNVPFNEKMKTNRIFFSKKLTIFFSPQSISSVLQRHISTPLKFRICYMLFQLLPQEKGTGKQIQWSWGPQHITKMRDEASRGHVPHRCVNSV